MIAAHGGREHVFGVLGYDFLPLTLLWIVDIHLNDLVFGCINVCLEVKIFTFVCDVAKNTNPIRRHIFVHQRLIQIDILLILQVCHIQQLFAIITFYRGDHCILAAIAHVSVYHQVRLVFQREHHNVLLLFCSDTMVEHLLIL